MSKHTPGPWGVHFVGNEIVVTDRLARWTATVWPSAPEYEANARLIAAAPELLEACKAALQDFEVLDRHFTAAEWTVACKDTVALLRAAIAKAEGGGE